MRKRGTSYLLSSSSKANLASYPGSSPVFLHGEEPGYEAELTTVEVAFLLISETVKHTCMYTHSMQETVVVHFSCSSASVYYTECKPKN